MVKQTLVGDVSLYTAMFLSDEVLIAYLNKSYKLYILFLFVIAISLSRFGFFVAVAFALKNPIA